MSTILGFLKFGLIAGKPMQTWYRICLSLDGIIYSFVNFLFKLFLVLAKTNIFSNGKTYELIGRVYQLIGVIMLFIFTYAMLRKIVSPDGKDKESPSKMIFNIVKAIVLLAIVPSIFSYAFQIQNAILQQNTIGKLIIGKSGNNASGSSPNEIIDKGGITMAQGVFEAFFFPTNGDENVEVMDGITYQQMEDEVQQSGNFSVYQNAVEKVDDGTITYYWGMALIAGAVVIYMLISYCISLGFRIVKLAFYQVMAPVCIIASILPSQKEMLSRWIKTTLQVFLEVFIRIAILYFITYLLDVIKANMGNIFPDDLDHKLKTLGMAAIIMGLVTFMKSAPDLISKLTGIDSGNMSLGIKDQLAKGGLFTAGGIAGAMAVGGIRNAANGIRDTHKKRIEAKDKRDAILNDNTKSDDEKKKARQAYKRAWGRAVGGGMWSLFGSGVAGAASGAVHGANGKAASLKDMTDAIKKGADKSTENREARADYLREHGDHLIAGWKKSSVARATGINRHTGEQETYTYSETEGKWKNGSEDAELSDLNNVKYSDAQGKTVDSSGFLLNDKGHRMIEQGALLGHASYALHGAGGFLGITKSTEEMEKQVEALQAVVEGQKKVFNAIMDTIKSEAQKGKSDLAIEGYSASAVKAMQSIIGSINAGNKVTIEDVQNAFNATDAKFDHTGISLPRPEEVVREEIKDDDTEEEKARKTAAAQRRESVESQFNTPGYIQKLLDTYLKQMTDVGMDRLLSGDAYAKFNFASAATEYGKLQDAITEGFSKAASAMEKAGYRQGQVLTVDDLKKFNKVEFDSNGNMTQDAEKSLQNQIAQLNETIEERKKQEQRNAGKKTEEKK